MESIINKVEEEKKKVEEEEKEKKGEDEDEEEEGRDEKTKHVKRIWRRVRNPFNLSTKTEGSETFDRIDPLRGIVPDHLESETNESQTDSSEDKTEGNTTEDIVEASPDELFNEIAKGLHTILRKNNLYRPITLKLCVLIINILKERKSEYVAESKACYEEAYESALARLKEEMKLHNSDVFLKTFEEVYNTQMSRTFYFDSFVTDNTALISPKQQLEIERVDEAHKTLRDTIGNFFVLRKEKFAANNNEVDPLMPLKCVPLPTEKYKLKTYFPKSTDVIYYMYYTENFKKIYKHYFVIINGAIIILDDPNVNTSLKTLGYLPIPRERDIAPTSVIVSAVLPMHNLEFRHDIDKKMNTFTMDVSGPKIHIKMYLSNFGFLKFSKEALEKGREDARSFKMAQIYSALSIDEAELPLSRVELPPIIDIIAKEKEEMERKEKEEKERLEKEKKERMEKEEKERKEKEENERKEKEEMERKEKEEKEKEEVKEEVKEEIKENEEIDKKENTEEEEEKDKGNDQN